MYPGISAIPAEVAHGPLSRPRFRGVSHLSERTGESVYAAKFRGLGAAERQAELDRRQAAAEVSRLKTSEANHTRAMMTRAERSLQLGDDANAQLRAAGRQEVTPERALAVLNASLDRADAREVQRAVAQRNHGNTVPVMVNGTLAMADAGSDPRVAAARAAELRSFYRAPAPVNPLGMALTAPSPADVTAARAFGPEIPNSQAAVLGAIEKRTSLWDRIASRLGADGPITTSAPTSPLTSPIVLGALALGAFLLLRKR